MCQCKNISCVQSVEEGITYCTCTDTVPAIICPPGCVFDESTGVCTCVDSIDPVGTPLFVKINIKDYLEEIRWTISYDPKIKSWISFHDWHPEWMIPSYNHFLTVKTLPQESAYCPVGYVFNTLTGLCEIEIDKHLLTTSPSYNKGSFWRHNNRTDLFVNYYDTDYPWEIEYPIVTPNNITTLRNIEYTLDVYKYYNNGKDTYHVLDDNFDRAVVWNSEQNSGLLNLFLKPKNQPLQLLTYPIVNINSIDILYSKEENKFRFNQFYDITDDRGEFTNTMIPMWVTSQNGYTKILNPVYTDYNKESLQHKKFRHYGNTILLRKTISNDKKMILKLTNSKHLNSPR
jgi:hypothetical protein